MIQKDTRTLVFTAALSTIAKTQRQPKCPLTDEWIKMWYIRAMEYYSASKKNETAIFHNMDGPGDYHVKSEK